MKIAVASALLGIGWEFHMSSVWQAVSLEDKASDTCSAKSVNIEKLPLRGIAHAKPIVAV